MAHLGNCLTLQLEELSIEFNKIKIKQKEKRILEGGNYSCLQRTATINRWLISITFPNPAELQLELLKT